MKWNHQHLFEIPTAHLERIEKGLINALETKTHGTLATDIELLRQHHAGTISKANFYTIIARRDTVRLRAIQKELEYRCDSTYGHLLQSFWVESDNTVCHALADRILDLDSSEVRARRVRLHGPLIQSKRVKKNLGLKLTKKYRR